MKIKNIFISSILALVAVGCGKENTASETSKTETIVQTSSPGGGETYESYYNRFLFQVGKCKVDNTRYYKYAGSEHVSPLASDSGRFLQMYLYLQANLNYMAVMQVLKPDHRWGGDAFYVTETYLQNGKWSIQGDALVLENLGVGHTLTYNGIKAVNFHLSSPKMVSVLNNSESVLVLYEGQTIPKNLEQPCY